MSAPLADAGVPSPFGQAVPQGQYQQPQQQYQPVDNSYQQQQPQGVPNIFHPPVTQPAPGQTAGGTQQTSPYVFKQDVQPVQNGIPQPQAMARTSCIQALISLFRKASHRRSASLASSSACLAMYGGMGGGISF